MLIQFDECHLSLISGSWKTLQDIGNNQNRNASSLIDRFLRSEIENLQIMLRSPAKERAVGEETCTNNRERFTHSYAPLRDSYPSREIESMLSFLPSLSAANK